MLERLVSAWRRKLRCSGYAPGSRSWLVTILRSSSNFQFLTNGRGICFWRFAAGTGYGRFVTTASDATR